MITSKYDRKHTKYVLVVWINSLRIVFLQLGPFAYHFVVQKSHCVDVSCFHYSIISCCKYSCFINVSYYEYSIDGLDKQVSLLYNVESFVNMPKSGILVQIKSSYLVNHHNVSFEQTFPFSINSASCHAICVIDPTQPE